jgi:formylglycine-generating enzyme required for sulfatase activity
MNLEISPKESERYLNWYDAMMYCQLLVIDGKNDWRLPTKKELDYIYHSQNHFVGSLYWSSTEYDGGSSWIQNLSSGNQNDNYKGASHYVRPVRTIEPS